MFKAIEVLNFAVQVEKNGEIFYNTVAELSEDAKVKEIFTGLAKAEAQHIVDFTALMEGVSNVETPEAYEGEFEEYMKALVDSHVFIKNTDVKALAGKVSSPREAIDLAMSFEKDSILFFSELRRVVTDHNQNTIDDLINQEHAHIRTLARLRAQI
ncbi:Rubrerythrin [Desulfonispora thiosulfatigenes DSM 11270]|uniref:Rubrerythrin n=1 Tax=Desulfonispora thiosulfatigenes DSM 11270 TaxID=656914 RepID=A0A1W1V261_DESTI|nr:ferritin family protein [Desulfonispora thiosulfatigenes]SMB87398.1 Rubrerythrin [Desulfonispora thiosulfatigenes DSM 11270]